MKAQRVISKHILNNISPHSASVAYSPGSSIYQAASIHCGSRWLIKLDIRNFFESISERSVYIVFRQAGYPALLSFEMARICTRVIPRGNLSPNSRWVSDRVYRGKIADYRSLGIGSLPQGAPSSPMLANLVSRDLDKEVANIADSYGLEYTRYADDITLSTPKGFSRKKASRVIQSVYGVMRKYGLEPNATKASVSPPGSRKIVLGLLVNGDYPRLTKEFKARLDQHLYFCLKEGHGPVKHMKVKEFSSVLGFKNHLRGLVMYAKQVEPKYGSEKVDCYNRIKWPF